MYEVLKVFHISSVIVWMSGMIIMPMLIAIGGNMNNEYRVIYSSQIGRIANFVVTPAMVIAWVLGLGLVVSAGWFGSGWVVWKIMLVVVLSGLHGFFSGQLRRLANEESFEPLAGLWILTPVQIVIVLGISYLVILKP